MMSNHYAQQQHYGYGQPQGPPSPPMDDTSKCSLPSISNLLGLADGGSPTSESAPSSQQQGKQSSLRASCSQAGLTTDIGSAALSQKSETRPNSSHYNATPVRGGTLPPTPPMSSDASFDGYAHSPSTKSVGQLPAQNYYYDSAPHMSHLESEAHRQQMVPRIPVQPAYTAPAFASPYMANPAMASYYPSMQPTPPPQPQVSGLYYQRPLPQVSIHIPDTPVKRQPLDTLANFVQRLSLPCHSASPCPRLGPAHGSTTTTSRLRPQLPSRSRRTATSARLATRRSPVPAPCASTATLTLVRSPSSALTPAAARPSASGAT